MVAVGIEAWLRFFWIILGLWDVIVVLFLFSGYDEFALVIGLVHIESFDIFCFVEVEDELISFWKFI